MTIDKISYQKIFPTGIMYLNHKIGVEVQLTEGDDPDEAFRMAKETVERWNTETNPSMGIALAQAGFEPVIQVDKSGDGISQRLLEIDSCTDSKVLEIYKLIVKSNPVLQEAYNKKMEQLKSNEHGK